jgi:hypothetical protein
MKTSFRFILALALLGIGGFSLPVSAANPVPYVVWQPDQRFRMPDIVLQFATDESGAEWEKVNNPKWYEATPPILLGRAARYVQEALQRMTGKEFSVNSTPDLSAGIVLTLMNGATDDIRNDPEVKQALKEDPKDAYAAKEAFFIRSEQNRLLVVANTPAGLLDAVADLMKSVGYEVLGMGPDWIFAPDYRKKPLVFAINRAGRPGFYIRGLGATSGQSYGVGTIMSGLSDPKDETVDASYWRWMIGTRMYGTSMPGFPGHALQAYHKDVLARIKGTGAEEGEGFLAAKIPIGPKAERPAASPQNQDWLWIDSEGVGKGGAPLAWLSDGKTWIDQDPAEMAWNLDLSVPLVRQVIFKAMKTEAEAWFEKNPDELFVFASEAEDGAPGNSMLDKRMKYKNWYPEYCAAEKIPFGQPYVLHGFKGLDHPKETWDPSFASDNMFAFACFLLHEFDKYVDGLPKNKQVTFTGKSKKEMVRCSFYSYNYHDVPPNFNPDPRIRVMIASYPKHRGVGKWEAFKSQEDMARAFKIMLPREPSGDYRIISLSYYSDPGPGCIPPGWSNSAAAIADDYRRAYDAGYRAINEETDFNFGKLGLGYYLISKILWNPAMTAKDLDAIRDRWFQRAFGSAWKEMKAYYDFMNPENYPVNGPNSWAKAIRLIDAASQKLEASKEPEAQRRVDDVKQYWYSHYLMDTGKFTEKSPELKEYIWKGQMSYMVAMHVVVRRNFKGEEANAVKAAAAPVSDGPAHYTHAETQAWWAKVLDCWKPTAVNLFSDAALANGKPAKSADLNDLVAVKEFQTGTADAPFIYNSGYMKPVPFLMVARQKDDIVGFKLVWPYNPKDNYYIARKLPYGVEIWDPAGKKWESWMDKTQVFQQSVEKKDGKGSPLQVVDVQLKAPRPGTYRFDIGYGGNASSLTSFTYDPAAGKYASPVGFTYYTNADGLTQSPVYFYIPKSTKRLDLETWDNYKGKTLYISKSLPPIDPNAARKVDLSEMGTHTIELQEGESGTVARLDSNGFAFPYCYSIPTFWAKSPDTLLIPRAIAEADALTILGAPEPATVPTPAPAPAK